MKVVQISVEELSLSTSSPFQSSYWASVKHTNGWDASAYTFDGKELLVLKKNIFLKYALCYIPYGPDLARGPLRYEHLQELSDAIHRYTGRNVFAMRWDVPWDKDAPRGTLPRRIKIAPYSIQPEGTVIISLTGGEDAVFAQMRKRAKRNITRSMQQIDISEWDGSPKNFNQWYESYRETSVRDSFKPRAKAYMETVLQMGSGRYSNGVESRLYLAWEHNRMIGGNIVLYTKDMALYLFGASLRGETSASPSYALQWYTIKQAIARGCRIYDLYGIAPGHDVYHHLHNLNLFKTGFGGEQTYRDGCFDVVYNPIIYDAYLIAEHIRMARSR